MTQAVALTKQQKWTPEQMKLITDVVAKNASPDELKLFLYRCKHMGLDPLKPGQIHFVKYGNGPGTIVVGIEGFRLRAHRSGKLSGLKRGVINDDKGNLVGGWAEAYRSDWQHPARNEVLLAEYSTGRGPWQKMPAAMVQKVAEAGALRMAFPDELGGVYAQEEMDQATSQVTGGPLLTAGLNDLAHEVAASGGGAYIDTAYKIPFGKYAQRSLEEVGPDALASYVRYIEETAARKGEPLKPVVQEFIDRASAYIVAFEKGALSDIPVEPGSFDQVNE